MPGDDAFEVEGRVTEVLPNGTWRVELSNGHNLCAFATGGARKYASRICPGDKVWLKLTPYDLSQGRIIVESGKTLK
jgi:translation initiation factor IF-1